ncbi:MAG: MATE family efflux transporter [Treponema sp.]|jgi:putative MATE family efflux protein|nr:MATE family efflux transporter [Treponema sp.]
MDEKRQQRTEERRRLMLEGNLLRIIPVIAFPQVVTMLIDALYNIADTYFVSQLGPAATAAVGINDSTMHIIRALALAFGMGAASYISRLLGAGKDQEASRAASTTIFTAMGFIAGISVLGYIFLSPLMTFLGATESAKPYSMAYGRWTLLFAPFTAGTVCLSQTLRGEGSTAFAMCGSVSGCVINLFLDPLLITAFNWGVSGAAIATGISKVISFGILLFPFISQRTVVTISLRLFSPRKDLYGEIARMGIPVGMRTSMMTLSTIVINNMAAGFGDIALAAVAVANKCMRLVSAAIMGFGQGFQPIAGYCWGARKYGRVKKAFFYTSAIGFVISAVLGALLAVFARRVVGIFSGDLAMIDAGVILVRSQSVVLPPHVWVLIAGGLFQGTGKPFQAGLLGLSRQIFSLIPSVIILTSLFGLTGLVYAQAAADLVSFCIALGLVIPMILELNRLQKRQGDEEKIQELETA